MLKDLRTLYRVDSPAQALGCEAHARLVLQKEESAPITQARQPWMKTQFEEHQIEPNSCLRRTIACAPQALGAARIFLRAAASRWATRHASTR
jgi:hypothetical protein